MIIVLFSLSKKYNIFIISLISVCACIILYGLWNLVYDLMKSSFNGFGFYFMMILIIIFALLFAIRNIRKLKVYRKANLILKKDIIQFQGNILKNNYAFDYYDNTSIEPVNIWIYRKCISAIKLSIQNEKLRIRTSGIDWDNNVKKDSYPLYTYVLPKSLFVQLVKHIENKNL